MGAVCELFMEGRSFCYIRHNEVASSSDAGGAGLHRAACFVAFYLLYTTSHC